MDYLLVKAIIKAESDFNPKAVSKKGAMGLMQIMPQNFQHLQIQNPFDPRENIMGGTRYFKYLYDRFDGKLALSLAAYNAGPTAVEHYNQTHTRITISVSPTYFAGQNGLGIAVSVNF